MPQISRLAAEWYNLPPQPRKAPQTRNLGLFMRQVAKIEKTAHTKTKEAARFNRHPGTFKKHPPGHVTKRFAGAGRGRQAKALQ